MAPKTALINSFITKMGDPDMDFRYMALSDLTNTIIDDPQLFGSDESLEQKTTSKVVSLVEDKNSEVKNQAVKCLGQLVKIIREAQLSLVVKNLVDYIGGKDLELRDISGLALKTVTAELPSGSPLTERACALLAPRLLESLRNSTTPPETIIEMLSILSILVSRFPVYLADVDPSPVATVLPLIEHARAPVRKRAVVVLAQAIPITPPAVTDKLIHDTILPALQNKSKLDQQRSTVLLVGAMARYAPDQISAALASIIPSILELANRDDEELRENCLQTLEILALRCPSELLPFVPNIINIGTTLIKYDPNYNEDAEDEEMGDADEEEDDEDLGEDYSDDEDTSYKIRRSANKLLAAIIATRPDHLVAVYRTVAPILIARFGEREESVRLDVWSSYDLLLQQTRLYGSAPQVKDTDIVAGTKRKRADDGMDVEDTPYTLLRSQTASLLKALLKYLTPKTSDNSLQAGFNLLRSLLLVAPGSLSAQLASLSNVASSILNKTLASSSSNIHSAILSFLELVFSTHPASSFAPVLPQLTDALLKSLSEKDPRVAAAGFHVFATLLEGLKPVSAAQWVDVLYDQTLTRLERSDTDPMVRGEVERCISQLWISATGVLQTKSGAEWVALRKSSRTEGAVKVIGTVAKDVDFPIAWVDETVAWVLNVVRRSVRSQKDEAFGCLIILLNKYKSGVPSELVSSVVPNILPFLGTTEISHFSNALSVFTLLLKSSPQASYPVIESDVLPVLYPTAVSSLPSGVLQDTLVEFISALVKADPPIANRLILGLMHAYEKSSVASASATNTSRFIGAVVHSDTSLAAGTIKDFSRTLKDPKAAEGPTIFALHVVGEIGRFIDMALQKDVFDYALAMFNSPSQGIRSAASFAVGNIAIGNLSIFLPVVVQRVTSADQQRLLALHALKEVVTHCSSTDLEAVGSTLWPPLFDNPENAEESTRNVAAACLGRLTTTNPARYLPLLQSKLKDPSPAVRATVVASIRYTFADNASLYDEHLSSIIVDFFSLVTDSDLIVRRLSLTALNAAARNKPALIRDHLLTLLPLLYGETVIKPELIHVVDMGPWKHRVDDGLEIRKTAFETMYTLLDTSLSGLDLHVFFNHVLKGLADESDEIKVLCHMMLFRLSQVAPTTVSQRLDEVSPELEEAVKGAKVTKDTVKQDLERAGELQRSALRAIVALSKLSSPTTSPRLERLVESIERGPLAREYRELQ